MLTISECGCAERISMKPSRIIHKTQDLSIDRDNERLRNSFFRLIRINRIATAIDEAAATGSNGTNPEKSVGAGENPSSSVFTKQESKLLASEEVTMPANAYPPSDVATKDQAPSQPFVPYVWFHFITPLESILINKKSLYAVPLQPAITYPPSDAATNE